jgi:beta-1,4-mannosyl-glycoprotein beta-1,4-N-acetylglucosaminyltransferase
MEIFICAYFGKYQMLRSHFFVDTFLFNNEFEMLDIRLDIMQSYTDLWIIAEGNRTLTGISKPYYLSDNIDYYRWRYGDRFRVIQVDLDQIDMPWDRSTHSRRMIQQGLVDLSYDVVVSHSDLDEIVDPEKLPKIIDYMTKRGVPVSCDLKMYVGQFDRFCPRTWSGNVIARKDMFGDPNYLYKGASTKRKRRNHCAVFPDHAGWHWTWIGNDEVIMKKTLSTIAPYGKDPEQVLKNLRQNKTHLAVNHKIETEIHDPEYPDVVNDVLRIYPYWSEMQDDITLL